MDVIFELHGNTFTWDEAKAATNRLKHGIRFEEAVSARRAGPSEERLYAD